jgi:hypothetical protein
MRHISVRFLREFVGPSLFVQFGAVVTVSAFIHPAAAEPWSRENAGIFIYQRDVPTQPAQIVGEPAPPDQVILSGPDSPFDPIANIGGTLTDLEAGQITGQSPAIFEAQVPQAPPSSTDPQGMVGYATSLASSVSMATQNTVVDTVNQVTSALNSTTSSITSALSGLPSAGDF